MAFALMATVATGDVIAAAWANQIKDNWAASYNASGQVLAPTIVSAVNSATNSVTQTDSGNWVTGILTQAITPRSTAGKIVVIGSAQVNTDDAFSLRVGVDGDFGPTMLLDASAGGLRIVTAVHAYTNASTAAKTATMDALSPETNGQAFYGYRWLMAFWVP